MRCPQCGKDWPETYKGCPECFIRFSTNETTPLPELSPAVSSSPDLSTLRLRLDHLDDPQIDALALDHFPQVHDKFARGLQRGEKINLLLDHCHRIPEAIPVLERWLDQQPATCNEQDALACYLRHVIEENARLQLQGIRSAEGLVSIALEEVYITLTATVRKTVAEEEAWIEEMTRLAPGEAKRQGIERPRESVQQVKVQVQEALALHPRLVVLGDPGCGKTTLLRYLALTFARDFRDDGRPGTGDRGWVKARLSLDERRLPVLLPLRDFARYLEKKALPWARMGPNCCWITCG